MTRPVGASFRDPSGIVFEREGVIYRQVNARYRDDYGSLIGSGLYDELVEKGLLISHEEVDPSLALTDEADRVLRPTPLAFISYPYEWSFGMLKDAALLTLAVQRHALDRGMILKDASAYNVQFMGSQPVFIDTLSFERYQEGQPWIAYRQFCQHFMLPLLLMAQVDIRLGDLLRSNIDGVPLDLGSRLLPLKSWFRPSTIFHVHLHARSMLHFATKEGESRRGSKGRVSEAALRGLIDGLERAVKRLRWRSGRTEWSDYETTHGYAPEDRSSKEEVVETILSTKRPKVVWDLGANVGTFSRIAESHSEMVVSIDGDAAAVERNYRRLRSEGSQGVLPLCMDLANPSPSLGWEHEERSSLLERGPADIVLALALVHHLAIAGNVPLNRIARFMRKAGRCLLIEWVPKADPQVQRLLSSRLDVFDAYSKDSFETEFSQFFDIVGQRRISATGRILYRMEGR